MFAQLILGLSILVTLHELGHFLAARAFGMRVEKFYLFFDAWGGKIMSMHYKDTEYGIGWLPFGGYVKIAGMVDESMDTEALKQPPQPWEYRAKPAWQRLIVMVAGVVMNTILGIVIYSFGLFHYAKVYLPKDNVKDGIYAYQLARNIGFQTGDKVKTINGKPFERFEDLVSTRILFGATLVVDRNGKDETIVVPDNFYRTVGKAGRGRFLGPDNIVFSVDSVFPDGPAAKAGLQVGDRIIKVDSAEIATYGSIKEEMMRKSSQKVAITVLRNKDTLHLNTQVTDEGTIGFKIKKAYNFKAYSLGAAIVYGASDAIEALVTNAKGLGKLFTGKEKATDSVQGPIGIAQIYGGAWDWQRFWLITGLLSMVLAFMNILPIPALDGGHVIFLLIESATGRKFSDKFMERAQIVGMVLLLALMVFSIGNDIWKHILN